MIIAITIPSFSAANTALNTSQKVSFTAECNKAGYEFSVYKIAFLVTSTSPYSVKYNANVSSAAVKAAIADGNITESERAKILNELYKDTALSGATIVGTYKVDTDGTRKTFSNLAQGIYYVRATNFPAGVKSVANSAFALPYYTAENGWVYNLDTINLASKVEEGTPIIEKKTTNSTKNNVNFTDVSIGDTLYYKCIDINVVLPSDTTHLGVEKGRDLVTLVTCTPYSVNTHRLLVTGERMEKKELSIGSTADEAPAEHHYNRYADVNIVPAIIVVAAIAVIVPIAVWRRRRKHEA